MKTLTFKPTDKIKFSTTDNFVDDFSSYLDSILKYWSENFKDKTLNITKTSDNSVTILTDSNNQGSMNSLYNTLKSAAEKKTTEIRQTINGYEVKWIAKEGAKQEKTKVEKKQKVTWPEKDQSSGEKIISALFNPVASTVAGAIKAGLQLAHYKPDEEKKLTEEINRIKELLK